MLKHLAGAKGITVRLEQQSEKKFDPLIKVLDQNTTNIENTSLIDIENIQGFTQHDLLN